MSIRLPDDFENPEFSTVTIQRDLFYGYDTLMENVSDPSHIDFAHHKVRTQLPSSHCPLPGFFISAARILNFLNDSTGYREEG